MFDGTEDSFRDFDAREPLEICWDDAPRGVCGVCSEQHFLSGLVVFAPFATVSPIFVGDFPVLVGVGFASLEAVELLVLRNVEIDFDEDGSVVDELLFEAVDFLVGAPPFTFFCKAFDSFNEDASVPRAVEDGDVAVGGQASPESAQVVVLVLFLGGFSDGVNAIEAGIQAFDGSLDCAAFSGGVGAFEDGDERPF